MSTDQNLDAWLEQEITIILHEPSPENPHHTASIEEFTMTGEGDTLDDAIGTLFSKLLAYGESFLKAGHPLPPRAPGIHTGDERADAMNGR